MIIHTTPKRSEVAASDMWDLTALFANTNEWEKALKQTETLGEHILTFKETLSSSAEICVAALESYAQLELLSEKVGIYAHLLKSADESDSAAVDKFSRYVMLMSTIQAKLSFFIPEIQAIADEKIRMWITSSRFEEYRVFIEKLLRMKPYILSEKEERIMALQSEVGEASHSAFSVLTNVDFNFGTVHTSDGEKPLTQTTWSSFMENSDREIRKTAYHQFYGIFDAHKNTLASMYGSSVSGDIYEARSRGYPSSLEKSLFPDKVPVSVYDTLVSTVRSNLEPLHNYYKMRKKILKVDELRHYDVYV